MKGLRGMLKELRRYPSAILGLSIIFLLVAVAIYAVVTIPYDEAVRLWRGGEDIWYDSPKNAQPLWINWFTRDRLPKTIVVNSDSEGASKAREVKEGMTDITFSLSFDYPYDGFPKEMTVFFDTDYASKLPYASLTWHTPDGRDIRIGDFSLEGNMTYRLSLDAKLQRRLGSDFPHIALFSDPDAEQPVPVKGTYEMRFSVLVFSPDDDVDAELVVYGQVHGLAGTDHRRRELIVPLLYGTPVALAFGLLAALGTTITTMFFAAMGTWFGGWLDELIQRITEVVLVLPGLNILIMIGTFYSRSIWLMLGAVILLNIFGAAIKTYRAIFMQEKEAHYIEAARAYGATNRRIILRYLVPRIIPLMIPQLVVLIPGYVFLEAALAVLGLGDPVLPTWGKVINDANSNGALFQGHYYWILEPSALLMLTGFAFAMLGYSLDRIFNPKLRGL